MSLLVLLLVFGGAFTQRLEFNVHKVQSQVKTQAIPLEMMEVIEAETPFEDLFTKDLKNVQNLQYYGTLLVGTSRVPLTFIFDTGSNEIWFPSVDCDGCQGGFSRYDTSSSDLYHQESSTPKEIQYGKGRVWGYPSTDQVWFTSTQKIDDMPVLLVYKEEDFAGTVADGIMGLAPLDQGTGNPGPFTLTYLKNNGIIKERTLSFNYGSVGDDSTMGFGEVNPQFISDPDKKVTLPLIYKGILYFVSLSASYYGNQQLSYTSAPALVDTGTSLIVAPISPMVNLLKYLRSQTGSLYTCMGGSLYCVECAGLDMSESLKFQFGEDTLGISFQDLFLRQGDYCALLMSPMQSSMWILGDVFIRNYYIAIKYDEGIIDLYPKNESFNRFNDSEVKQDSSFPWAKLIIGIAVALLLCLVVPLIYMKWMKSTKKSSEHEADEPLIEGYQLL